MDTGTKISAIGHIGLIGWVMVAGLFDAPAPPTAPLATDVELISGEEFAALMPAQPGPQVPQAAPGLPEPAPPQDAMPPVAAADDRPALAAPQPEDQAEPDTAPDVGGLLATPQPDVAAAPPEPAAPPSSQGAVTPPEVRPRPRDAPRVAPIPAPQPEPDARVADTVRDTVTPDETAEAADPQERQEAEAPEAATTEIITEATETAESDSAAAAPATAAPQTSARPRARPERPAPTPAQAAATPAATTPPEPVAPEPDAPEPDAPDAAPAADPIAAALAAALADETVPTPPQRGPSGPPLTGAETDGLRRAIQRCWNVGSASTEALRTTVVVGVTMAADGRPEAVRMISSDGPSDAATAIAFDAARRAVRRCAVNAALPPEKYDHWREIEMVFNPEGMRLR